MKKKLIYLFQLFLIKKILVLTYIVIDYRIQMIRFTSGFIRTSDWLRTGITTNRYISHLEAGIRITQGLVSSTLNLTLF